MAYKRVVAALIDLVCSIILFAIVESIFLFLYSKFDISFDFSNIKYFNLIYFSMMSISVIILCVYFFSCDYFFSGNSFGKYIMRLVAKNDDGTNINLYKAVLRTILKLVSIPLYLSFITVFIDKQNRSIYDMILHTRIFIKVP